MSRQVSKQDLAVFLLLLIIVEMFVDAIAGEYIKTWISENLGTIPVFLGLLAVILAVWGAFC